MKRITRICCFLLLITLLTLSIHAQTSHSNNKTTSGKGTNGQKPVASQDTVTKGSKTNVEKNLDKGNAYLKMAADQKNLFKTMFPAKKGDTVYAVIAGIDYRDPNLKILKQKMDNVKNTKGLTSGYHNGTVIIKIFYKQGDASTLYDNLDDEIKNLFEVEDMEGCRMILNYKLAKQNVSSN